MSETAGATSHPTGSSPQAERGWPPEADRARLHFVSGKGGTGKSTVAAALALALAAGGRKVLLVEVEGRQGIAQLFDVPPLSPVDTKVASADGGGEVYALAIDIETAFLEYLDMFYNLGFAGRAMRRVGAIEFATTIAPGLRDVLLTGKVKERAVRTEKNGRLLYDEIVVDSPPTGRIGSFLDVTTAMRDLAKTGPVRSQSEGVVKLLHSEQTLVHLVTLLEALPVQETADAAAELAAADLRLGTVVVNRTEESFLPAEALAEAASGSLDAAAIEKKLADAGITLSEDDFAGLLTESIEHASRLAAQRESEQRLGDLAVPRLTLPALADGMDLGGLYELAHHLTEQGVR
ncbi:ArsA-related P-loop ATPase [Rhodococcoides corynebacterioides]|uniref:Anion-transporting ArsA/GET3 family ATPase n=1 Tax=Rhodococcoides corynebacterioides TaxID=53972 RepID=A0ABS2KYF2_9NOCA|nr:anion-transporting ArsA/GET3 family ATPase [Rhodococcus corynebacterioides]MBP1115221.1 anion-transporting ArsA/GET3 family ATPase [Rhodococcus sp. PvP016]